MDLGQEPPPLSEMPLEFEDFPTIVHTSLEIFNNLPDTYVSRMEAPPLYTGKDLSSLPVMYELHYVTDLEDKRMVLEFINLFDIQARKDLNKPRPKAGK